MLIISKGLLLKMVNKKTDGGPTLKLDDTRLWIVVLLILLAVANTLVFYVYQKTYPTQSLPYQIWNYLKSDPFKAVTISIVLPIVLFLLERLFEIRKTHKERWVKEKEAGMPNLKNMREKGKEMQVEKVGKELRKMFAFK